MGRDHGTEIFPLPFADNSVDEIRASHVLEHFPYRQLEAVLVDWVRALKPGGRLRIAVPDFPSICKSYFDGDAAPHEGYIMGGQVDDNDYHKSVFDREKLRRLMAGTNLVLVQNWTSELDDTAANPISLNLEGYKPHRTELRVSGAMSVPRLGFMDNFFCAMEAAVACKVKFTKHGGAYWGQSLTKCFQKILDEDNPDFILALDYDSVFKPKHLARMMQLLMLYPEIDALAPIQSSRHLQSALFTVKGPDGKNAPKITRADFDPEIMPVATAHFGLTLINAQKLKDLPKPWFHSLPSPEGTWEYDKGARDEDITFWNKWTAAGNTLFLANRVPIGHAELMVRWPDENLQVFYQSMTDFQKEGVPADAWK
jgi:hypothetical protein